MSIKSAFFSSGAEKGAIAARSHSPREPCQRPKAGNQQSGVERLTHMGNPGSPVLLRVWGSLSRGRYPGREGGGIARLPAAIVSGAATVVLAWYTTAFPLDSSATSAERTHYISIVSTIAVTAILFLIVFAILDDRERGKDKADLRESHRLVAEMHAKIVAFEGQNKGAQKSVAYGTVRNPSIAESVKNGDCFTRFKRENVTSLRQAAQVLAKGYRDFAATVKGGYDGDAVLQTFWADYPFGELSAMKDRLKTILGQFNVTSGTEWLPTSPENIVKLANDLEKEAVKVPSDILL